jgi:hypothetical protein
MPLELGGIFCNIAVVIINNLENLPCLNYIRLVENNISK